MDKKEISSPEKKNTKGRDIALLFSGVFISFIMQLIYDSLTQEQIWLNILPKVGWIAILAVISLALLLIVVLYLLFKD